MLRRAGSNHRPSGYEPDELPLLYSAIYTFSKGTAKVLLFSDIRKFFVKKMLKNVLFPYFQRTICPFTW